MKPLIHRFNIYLTYQLRRTFQSALISESVATKILADLICK
jgi:AAA+ ATPase superfamily predicted ATPase